MNLTICIDPQTSNLLKRSHNKSRLICRLVKEHFLNPIERLRKEKRELVKKMNRIDDEIKTLEEIKEVKNDE